MVNYYCNCNCASVQGRKIFSRQSPLPLQLPSLFFFIITNLCIFLLLFQIIITSSLSLLLIHKFVYLNERYSFYLLFKKTKRCNNRKLETTPLSFYEKPNLSLYLFVNFQISSCDYCDDDNDDGMSQLRNFTFCKLIPL